jgi:hypothetical protein
MSTSCANTAMVSISSSWRRVPFTPFAIWFKLAPARAICLINCGLISGADLRCEGFDVSKSSRKYADKLSPCDRALASHRSRSPCEHFHMLRKRARHTEVSFRHLPSLLDNGQHIPHGLGLRGRSAAPLPSQGAFA